MANLKKTMNQPRLGDQALVLLVGCGKENKKSHTHNSAFATDLVMTDLDLFLALGPRRLSSANIGTP